MSSDWDDNEEEEDQIKSENKGKDNEKKTPQTNPRFFVAATLTLPSPKPCITEHFGSRSNVTRKKDEHKCDSIMMLLGPGGPKLRHTR